MTKIMIDYYKYLLVIDEIHWLGSGWMGVGEGPVRWVCRDVG